MWRRGGRRGGGKGGYVGDEVGGFVVLGGGGAFVARSIVGERGVVGDEAEVEEVCGSFVFGAIALGVDVVGCLWFVGFDNGVVVSVGG